jgi:thiamine biosynthesis lipoprotein
LTRRACAHRVEDIWGTAIGVDIREVVDPVVVDAVFDWFRRVDDLFSTWRPETEISRFGRREIDERDLSEEVREVLALCDFVSIRSGGAFDITVGADPRVAPRPGLGPVDPSGLVKGWALDRAAEELESHGVRNFTINAGGDVVTRGRPAPDQEWRVGIQHPWQRDKVAKVVAGTDLCVATSGRYERGEHIVDPSTGRHPTGLIAATVIAGELALADGYATAAVVLGDRGMAWLAGLGDVEGMGITDAGEVVSTAGFGRYVR